MAHVHVVIIGFAAFDTPNKRIYEYEGDKMTLTNVQNVSPYLVEGPDFAISSRSTPLGNVPSCIYGSKPTDGGNLIIEEEDREAFLEENPGAKKYVRPLLCTEEYLYSIPRWCLWLLDADPGDIRSNPGLKRRVEAVEKFRAESKKIPTQKMANMPSVFAEIRQPSSRFMVVPQHTSELRKYVPFGYFSPKYIVHNSCSAIPDATHFHFGVLSSVMHMAWVRLVCGRIKSDYRYSTRLVYNNFPWPIATPERHERVEEKAKAILAARDTHLPPKGTATLADLYHSLSMPSALVKAHADLDRAVEKCYRPEPFHSDRERVEFLFALYQKLTTPLVPALSAKIRRRKTSKDQ